MNGDPLNAAHAELNELFEHEQAALDPWTSDDYAYDYTSGLARALAILESHMRERR